MGGRTTAIIIALAVLLGELMAHAQATNTFPASGNVGIGTTTPTNPLEVVGNWQPASVGGALRITGDKPTITLNSTGAGTIPISIHSGSDNNGGLEFYKGIGNDQFLMGIYGNGNVGIGTANPQSPLQVGASVAGGTGASSTLSLVNPAGEAGVVFTSYESSLSQTQPVGGIFASAAPGWSRVLHFMTNNNWGNPAVEAMTINGSNVGIGTTTPGAKLEVDGNIKLTSGSGASITFPDGSVQSTAYTGVTHPGKFIESSTPYSTAVLGVYSTKPGFVGRRLTGSKSPDEVPMAMVGIVPTKVTADNGPVHVGDLLVTSSTPGYAMKGTDRSRMLGAVIGKALGNLDSGKGVIEVGITLQ
jgi:hypothetical protein